MSRVLLKSFDVPNKQAFWSKFKIPGVPILVTHINKFLVTAPSAPITMETTDTLIQFHMFGISRDVGRMFLGESKEVYRHYVVLFIHGYGKLLNPLTPNHTNGMILTWAAILNS